MKKFIIAAMVGFLTLLSGCSQLSEFSISESQINDYLANKVKI